MSKNVYIITQHVTYHKQGISYPPTLGVHTSRIKALDHFIKVKESRNSDPKLIHLSDLAGTKDKELKSNMMCMSTFKEGDAYHEIKLEKWKV